MEEPFDSFDEFDAPKRVPCKTAAPVKTKRTKTAVKEKTAPKSKKQINKE